MLELRCAEATDPVKYSSSFEMQMAKIACVAAILHTVSKEILLIQRDEKPGLEFPGYWTLPGGLVEDQETPEAAIQRELREEIGKAPKIQLWKTYERPHHRLINGKVIVIEQHVYSGQIDLSISAIRLGEGQAIRYFVAAEIAELRLAYGFDKLLLDFLKLS